MKFFFFLLAFLVCMPLQVVAGAADLPGQAPVRLRSVQADFLQEKQLKILARPIISTGTFTFQAPQSLRWEYQKPVASLLLMHGGKVRKYVERDGQMVEDTRMQLDAMQMVLSEISNWLDGRFTDNKMFAVSFPQKQTILLTPKDQGMAAMISSIELKLADQKGLLDEVTIFEGPGSLTRLTFKNRRLNQEIPASLFTNR
jgi:outer membrane lipoprotein-sorting protein